jgi:uncharacterized membrane protein
MKHFFKVGLILILSVFSFLMVRLTIPYLAFDDHTAFLKIKQWVIHNSLWKTAFYIHVITSSFCLFAGFTQFSRNILKSHTSVHRLMGWMYVAVILLLSGPSGLIMSVYANGGLLSQSAFTMLSLLWMYCTYQAFYHARARNFSTHQKFMIRSYALTLSAVSLRAWKFLIVFAIRPQPMDAYMLVAWLGWVPNLVFAEWYIRRFLSAKLTSGETSEAHF